MLTLRMAALGCGVILKVTTQIGGFISPTRKLLIQHLVLIIPLDQVCIFAFPLLGAYKQENINKLNEKGLKPRLMTPSSICFIERRSRYVTLPWQQKIWMAKNRKSYLKVYSHYFKLHRFYSISFNLFNLCEIFFRTVSIVI